MAECQEMGGEVSGEHGIGITKISFLGKSKMDALRAVCDEAETITAKEFWPFPTYSDLLFSVK